MTYWVLKRVWSVRLIIRRVRKEGPVWESGGFFKADIKNGQSLHQSPYSEYVAAVSSYDQFVAPFTFLQQMNAAVWSSAQRQKPVPAKYWWVMEKLRRRFLVNFTYSLKSPSALRWHVDYYDLNGKKKGGNLKTLLPLSLYSVVNLLWVDARWMPFIVSCVISQAFQS